jgi:predicted PurR-regulated permease PerM
LQRFGPQLDVLRGRLIVVAESAGAEFLKLFFSIIVAGIFLGAAKGTMAGLRSVVNWLVGERSSLLLDVSATTVRSVARGVLGAAMLETLVAGIGMFAAGVPAFGFWAFLILVLSIIQVPPLLPLVPIAIYVLSTAAPFGATVFVICAVLAVAIDTFLKPILLGRGANVPMLIVLMGAIGGMILSGIVGLFAGAVVLVLGWELLQFCIHESDAPATQLPGPPQGEPAE